jgi:hypothetical protein
MNKLYRRFFPRWYYNRELKRLDPLIRKLAVPFDSSYTHTKLWGPPLSKDVLGDLYAYIFFDTPLTCTDSHLREVAEYLQSISRSGGFLCMDDILGYFKRKHKDIHRFVNKVVRNAVNNS